MNPEPSDPQMNCEETVNFLMDYVDGVLPGEARVRFDDHLRICPDCVTYMDNYRKAVALAGKAGQAQRHSPQGQVPAALIEAILKARQGT